jgi:hypothetical protein
MFIIHDITTRGQTTLRAGPIPTTTWTTDSTTGNASNSQAVPQDQQLCLLERLLNAPLELLISRMSC